MVRNWKLKKKLYLKKLNSYFIFFSLTSEYERNIDQPHNVKKFKKKIKERKIKTINEAKAINHNNEKALVFKSAKNIKII